MPANEKRFLRYAGTLSFPMEIVMNGVRREKRKCVVCGKEFLGKGRQKTCGHLCSDSPKMLKSKGRKKLQNLLDKIR